MDRTAEQLAKSYKKQLLDSGIKLADIYSAKRLGREEQKLLVTFIEQSGISKKHAATLFKVSYASVMNWFANCRERAMEMTFVSDSEEVKRLKSIINKFIELGGEALYHQVKQEINQSEYEKFMRRAEQEAKSILDKDLL